MNKNTNADAKLISQGVEALIDRLKSDGVNAGKDEADKIVRQAREQANQIINQANAEAKKMINEAHQHIQQEKKAAEDALQLAARNMRLELRQTLIDRFKDEVKRLVHAELQNEKTIRQLILMLTCQSAEKLQQLHDKSIEITLPKTVLAFEEIKQNPTLLKTDPLKHLVQGVTSEMLREGVTLKVNTLNQTETGLTVKIVGSDIQMDLTESAITEMILKHLQPRFRALLEGLMQ
jgi:V/A-type H+-transporting ATPase subunit E